MGGKAVDKSTFLALETTPTTGIPQVEGQKLQDYAYRGDPYPFPKLFKIRANVDCLHSQKCN